MPTLPYRLAAGAMILLALALHDLHRRGHQATRWREYLFLLLCAAAAMVYGIINDLITSTISWEYFWHVKGLYAVLQREPAAEPVAFRLHVIKIALQATWWVGLLAGVLLLIANNPMRGRGWPRLSYGRLIRVLGIVFVCAAGLAVIGGIAGYAGAFSFIESFAELVREDALRPYRLMAAWGAHLGGYVGAGIGIVIAAARIIIERRRRFAPHLSGLIAGEREKA